jgi:hypothetical protein
MTNTSTSVTNASKTFRASIAEEYDLEEDFLDAMTRLFVKAASAIVTEAVQAGGKATKAAAEPAKPRVPRKKSAYNVYVREQMKSADIQAISHKEKMSAIAAGWNALTAEQKKVYADMANGENDNADA